MREKLGAANLLEAVLKSKEAATPAPTKNSAKSSAIVPDNLPALTFDGGAVVQDCGLVARSRGLMLGCRVKAARKARGIKQGAEGVLVALLGKEATVKWDSCAQVCMRERRSMRPRSHWRPWRWLRRRSRLRKGKRVAESSRGIARRKAMV